jgi:hypothetical protein
MERFTFFRLTPYALLLALFFVSSLFAQWGPNTRLTFNSGSSYTSYNNAYNITANGDTLHIVWSDSSDGNFEIYHTSSTDGGTTWGANTRLTNDPNDSQWPSIAISGLNVYIVWWEGSYSSRQIYYIRSSDGGSTWQPDTVLSSGNVAYDPSNCASGSYVHVVWMDNKDQQMYEIYYKRSSDNGATWGPDTRLSFDTFSSEAPAVAVSGSNIHVIWWCNESPPKWSTYYMRSTDSGLSWSTPSRITEDSIYMEKPAIAVSDSFVHVVYSRYPYPPRLFYKRSTNNGTTWGPTIRLDNDSISSGWLGPLYPTISSSASNVHVTWYSYLNGCRIFYKHSTNYGASWGPDTRIINDTTSFSPFIAASGSRVHVVWNAYRDGNYEIYYKRNPTGNIGVEEGEFQQLKDHFEEKLSISPNPFVSFFCIPGHFSDIFLLYDISGRKVGTYQGDRVGKDLGPGVYFLKPLKGYSTRPVRVVKVR